MSKKGTNNIKIPASKSQAQLLTKKPPKEEKVVLDITEPEIKTEELHP